MATKRATFLQVAEPAGQQYKQVCPSIIVNQDLANACKASVANAENLAMTNMVNPDERPCNLLMNCSEINNAYPFSKNPAALDAFKACTGESGFYDQETGTSRPFTEDERALACKEMNEHFRVALAEIQKAKDVVTQPSEKSDNTMYWIAGGVAALAIGAYFVYRR